MTLKRIFLLLIIPSVLTGCWLDEAEAPRKKSLHVVADRLSEEDSLIIRDFGKAKKVEVTIEVLSPEAILSRIRSRRHNADIDVLLTEDASLRTQLQDLRVLKEIRNEKLFSLLERQFNNQHRQWIPVAHDPLVLSAYRDTSRNCPDIDFRSWHRKDSLIPRNLVQHHREAYRELLSKTSHLSWLAAETGTRKAGTEEIHTLSELVEMENAADSVYRSHMNRCRFYLVDRQRYISRITTASIYRHGRNSAEAESFLVFFTGRSYSVANGRNQLPTRKNVFPNWYIRSLSIH